MTSVGRPGALELTLRADSPLVMGGADPFRGSALRAPSLRGLLRWWYRAVDPGFAQLEKKIFGAVFEKTIRPSWIGIRVAGTKTPTNGVQLGDLLNPDADRGYLFKNYLVKGDLPRSNRPAGCEFTVRCTFGLQVRGVFEKDDEVEHAMRAVWASWWLFTNLGGAGYRSRRGLGSLSVTAVSISDLRWAKLNELLPLSAGAEGRHLNRENYEKHVRAGVETLKTWFSWTAAPTNGGELHRRLGTLTGIQFVPASAAPVSLELALDAAGKALMTNRTRNPEPRPESRRASRVLIRISPLLQGSNGTSGHCAVLTEFRDPPAEAVRGR